MNNIGSRRIFREVTAKMITARRDIFRRDTLLFKPPRPFHFLSLLFRAITKALEITRATLGVTITICPARWRDNEIILIELEGTDDCRHDKFTGSSLIVFETLAARWEWHVSLSGRLLLLMQHASPVAEIISRLSLMPLRDSFHFLILLSILAKLSFPRRAIDFSRIYDDCTLHIEHIRLHSLFCPCMLHAGLSPRRLAARPSPPWLSSRSLSYRYSTCHFHISRQRRVSAPRPLPMLIYFKSCEIRRYLRVRAHGLLHTKLLFLIGRLIFWYSDAD